VVFEALSVYEISRRLERAIQVSSDSPYPESLFMPEIHTEPPRPAAVLIPLLWSQDQWHILYTRRNANLPEHSGQVAFPGGRMDPEDANLDATALRETWEEIGITSEDVNILGRLPRFLTITNYLVTPVVGTIPWPYPIQAAQEEVSRIFSVPLEWLADPQNRELRQRALPAPFGPISVIFFKEYDGEVVWGATARFTLTLIETLAAY
jgi:8-oxo-dGTP pyrophosphatase MutT (NUDIX family)